MPKVYISSCELTSNFLLIFSDKQNRELREGIIHSVAQLVNTQITDRLTTVMMAEIPRHILPVIGTQLEKLKAQVLTDIGQKLRGCDQAIKESIMNVTSSKVCITKVEASVDRQQLIFLFR